jgi:hypothetical protein
MKSATCIAAAAEAAARMVRAEIVCWGDVHASRIEVTQ